MSPLTKLVSRASALASDLRFLPLAKAQNNVNINNRYSLICRYLATFDAVADISSRRYQSTVAAPTLDDATTAAATRLKSILDEQFSSSVTRWRESSFGEQSRAALESRAAAQNCRKSRNLKPFQLCTTRTSTPTKFQTKPRRDNKWCKTLSLPPLLAKRCW